MVCRSCWTNTFFFVILHKVILDTGWGRLEMGATCCGRSLGQFRQLSWPKVTGPAWPRFLGMRMYNRLGLSAAVSSLRFSGRWDKKWDWGSIAGQVPINPSPTGNDYPGGRFFPTLLRTVTKPVSWGALRAIHGSITWFLKVWWWICMVVHLSVTPPGKFHCAIFRVSLPDPGKSPYSLLVQP